MALFRFENFEIWQLAIALGNELFDISDTLEAKRLYRFAEQLRGAGMSISNNISEGAGSDKDGEFQQFLRYARRSCFECANILIILQMRGLIEEKIKERLFGQLSTLSRKIHNFSKALWGFVQQELITARKLIPGFTGFCGWPRCLPATAGRQGLPRLLRI